jgi:hypothetical protein
MLTACEFASNPCDAWTSLARGVSFVHEPEGWYCYRPRDPQATSLYKLMESLDETVKGQWDERLEARYGCWRGLADEARGALPRLRDLGAWLGPGALRSV